MNHLPSIPFSGLATPSPSLPNTISFPDIILFLIFPCSYSHMPRQSPLSTREDITHIKRPILQSIAPLPLHAVILVSILVPKLYSNLVHIAFLLAPDSEEFLPQAVFPFLVPLFGQERNDLVSAPNKVASVPPDAIRCVAVRDLCRIACIP